MRHVAQFVVRPHASVEMQNAAPRTRALIALTTVSAASILRNHPTNGGLGQARRQRERGGKGSAGILLSPRRRGGAGHVQASRLSRRYWRRRRSTVT